MRTPFRLLVAAVSCALADVAEIMKIAASTAPDIVEKR
jgi:hypothetical protein